MCQGEHGREAGSEGKGGNDNCARPELRSSCTRDGAQKGGKGNVRSQQNKKTDARDQQSLSVVGTAVQPQREERERANVLCSSLLLSPSISASQLQLPRSSFCTFHLSIHLSSILVRHLDLFSSLISAHPFPTTTTTSTTKDQEDYRLIFSPSFFRKTDTYFRSFSS